MKRNIAAVVLATAMLLATQFGYAQNKGADAMDLQALRAAVKADKRALVASTLDLTPAEAKKFWPVYDNYQRSIDTINRRRNMALEGLIAKDQVSDLFAKNLANELISTDEAEIKARRTLQSSVMKALPPRKAARYLQLEFNIRALVACDIAAGIPLIR